MQLSNLPLKFLKRFGESANPVNIRPIPVTTADPTAASQTTGWPANAFVPSGAGGIPPDGRDMNGLDNQLSSWAQWQSAGGYVPYDSVFQIAIGGYPIWSVVGSVTNPGSYWQSTAENNLTNPDTGGAGWQAWPAAAAIPWSSPGAIGNVAPNSGTFTSLYSAAGLTANGPVNATDLRIGGVGFTQFFGVPSSYAKLPSGMIIQCGRFFSATGNGDVTAFPATFPNTCAMAMVAGTDSSSNRHEVNVKLDAGFGFFTTWTWRNGSISSAVPVGWIAIGN